MELKFKKNRILKTKRKVKSFGNFVVEYDEYAFWIIRMEKPVFQMREVSHIENVWCFLNVCLVVTSDSSYLLLEEKEEELRTFKIPKPYTKVMLNKESIVELGPEGLFFTELNDSKKSLVEGGLFYLTTNHAYLLKDGNLRLNASPNTLAQSPSRVTTLCDYLGVLNGDRLVIYKGEEAVHQCRASVESRYGVLGDILVFRESSEETFVYCNLKTGREIFVDEEIHEIKDRMCADSHEPLSFDTIRSGADRVLLQDPSGVVEYVLEGFEENLQVFDKAVRVIELLELEVIEVSECLTVASSVSSGPEEFLVKTEDLNKMIGSLSASTNFDISSVTAKTSKDIFKDDLSEKSSEQRSRHFDFTSIPPPQSVSLNASERETLQSGLSAEKSVSSSMFETIGAPSKGLSLGSESASKLPEAVPKAVSSKAEGVKSEAEKVDPEVGPINKVRDQILDILETLSLRVKMLNIDLRDNLGTSSRHLSTSVTRFEPTELLEAVHSNLKILLNHEDPDAMVLEAVEAVENSMAEFTGREPADYRKILGAIDTRIARLKRRSIRAPFTISGKEFGLLNVSGSGSGICKTGDIGTDEPGSETFVRETVAGAVERVSEAASSQEARSTHTPQVGFQRTKPVEEAKPIVEQPAPIPIPEPANPFASQQTVPEFQNPPMYDSSSIQVVPDQTTLFSGMPRAAFASNPFVTTQPHQSANGGEKKGDRPESIFSKFSSTRANLYK